MENIKIQSTVQPDKHLSFEQWAKELRVSIRWNSSKLTDKSQQMMNLWDQERQTKYLKRLNLV